MNVRPMYNLSRGKLPFYHFSSAYIYFGLYATEYSTELSVVFHLSFERSKGHV